MGLLVDGVWQDQWYDTRKSGGRFERPQSRFRNWVTADGAPVSVAERCAADADVASAGTRSCRRER